MAGRAAWLAALLCAQSGTTSYLSITLGPSPLPFLCHFSASERGVLDASQGEPACVWQGQKVSQQVTREPRPALLEGRSWV